MQLVKFIYLKNVICCFVFQDIEKCKPDFWLCETGTCIEKNRLCDKKKDCPDGSDEGDFCHSYLCGPEKIHCPTGECIAKAKVTKKFVYISHFID